MFSRLATLLPIAALAAVATAAPSALEARNGGQCNGGANYCCDSSFTTAVQYNNIAGGILNPFLSIILGLLFSCDPITVVGVGSGAQCTTQQVCCNNVQANGVINIVCDPISVNA
ncbi:fungal hydrophobin [Imleria badia]|nr:fungal hydrophobin [Imleria badia]